MIRFVPDTLRDWLLRPIAMAAPDGWVYTEISAPDFRFAILLVLVAALLGFQCVRGRAGVADRCAPLALISLGTITAAAFVTWLATSGNGRYFMPFLILVGPLCIGVIVRLPVTRPMRMFAVALVLAAQGFALSQNSPWRPFDSWEWIAWREAPYFAIDTAPVASDTDVTYVTLSIQTLSLIAPQFPSSVRWVNTSAFDGTDTTAAGEVQYQRLSSVLDHGKLKLLQRAQPRAMDARDRPNARAVQSINSHLASHRLKLREPNDCVLLRSPSLSYVTMMVVEDSPEMRRHYRDRAGFWACTLDRLQTVPVGRHELRDGEERARHVFEKLEKLCPRFFAPGQSRVSLSGKVYLRVYPESDSLLMLAEDDGLYVKYERALNPQRLGSGSGVLQDDFALDCNTIKGRAGLPWERAI